MPELIPQRESMHVELKSDKPLNDSRLVEAAVCFANADGGEIFLGVEDDAQVTGLSEVHEDPMRVAALIANRTHPSLSVKAERLVVSGLSILRITVPKSRQVIATTDGRLLRRRLRLDGKPECTPLYPHEIGQRQADLLQTDPSDRVVEGATTADLDPSERVRLRRLIAQFHGDSALLPLSDDSLDAVLGLVRNDGGAPQPTVTGLLMLGTEEALRRHVPTHELLFQVMDGTTVVVNDGFRAPLLKVLEAVMDRFRARNVQTEVDVGLFRVGVPDVDERTFREALVNAVSHRDYTQLGAVHVRYDLDALTISNPGGFVEGVNLQNLLVVEPRPRNPRLVDALKRIGLAERTGRGIDRIFEGLLRSGRPAPDYSSSDTRTVVVRLSRMAPDLPFLRLLLDEERQRGAALPLDALLILSILRRQRNLSAADLAKELQRTEPAARPVIQRMIEAGLVEARGKTRSQTFLLSSRVYRQLGEHAEYIRQAGFDAIQHEQMILAYVRKHGRITRQDAVRLCRTTSSGAKAALKRLTVDRKLELHGSKRGSYYTIPNG